MKSRDANILVLPGFGGGLGTGDPEEVIWYRRWCARIATAQVVRQADWDHPDKDAWTTVLKDAVAKSERPVVLIGHSGGVLTIAHSFADARDPGPVRGAFLVAPPQMSRIVGVLDGAHTFDPRPTAPLPFPSMMIASRTDPWCEIEAATDMALDWGSALVDAGDAGHINLESDHGPWPEGLMMFTRFMATL